MYMYIYICIYIYITPISIYLSLSLFICLFSSMSQYISETERHFQDSYCYISPLYESSTDRFKQKMLKRYM